VETEKIEFLINHFGESVIVIIIYTYYAILNCTRKWDFSSFTNTQRVVILSSPSSLSTLDYSTVFNCFFHRVHCSWGWYPWWCLFLFLRDKVIIIIHVKRSSLNASWGNWRVFYVRPLCHEIHAKTLWPFNAATLNFVSLYLLFVIAFGAHRRPRTSNKIPMNFLGRKKNTSKSRKKLLLVPCSK